MTSEFEALKTNEFLRRRKLRLQQVREQSKDIAKKIRQRAKVEKLRQVVDLDAKKQKEYFECQERLVKELQVLYSRGVKNVGASHRSASELTQQDEVLKVDLSKLRGKEAAAALRKKRQERLDQQKKLLDRKLQAREAANEISRDKSSVLANKLISKSSSTKLSTNEPIPKPGSSAELATTNENNKEPEKTNNETDAVKTSDMATQWDLETIPNEWEPAVPKLALPTDKDTTDEPEILVSESKTDKSKRLDLFALSKEMPSSLRGKHTHETRERDTARPSLTLVSEYLQTRKLRLRQNEPPITNKKSTDDIQSLKQTILRTRTSNAEGSPFSVCQVLDEQVIPVPTWRAEKNCKCCSNSVFNDTPVPSRQFKSVTNSQINQIFSSIRSVRHSDLLPSPVLRGTSPFRRSKVCPKFFSGKSSGSVDKGKSVQENSLSKKNSVQMYNHSTRDTRDLPCEDSRLVVRDLQSEEDAYSQAMKEASVVFPKNKDPQKKIQDMRNKVAVTKQSVEKEYKDTMNFLSSLPKDKCTKTMKSAYMDERRQQILQENRQHKMQEEYKKIEKECRKSHQCTKSRNKSRSPNVDDSFENRDFQYSWMPVPESDGNLAIHAIPNTVKQRKSGNCVKFSKVDSYHEYRSRHKHTPPTKDTNHEKQPNKKVVETVIIDKNTSESSDSSSMSSDTSSVENMQLDSDVKGKSAKEINKNLSDAERIIIYKVLDSRTERKSKQQTKLLNEIVKSLSSIGKGKKNAAESEQEQTDNQQLQNVKSTIKGAENSVSFEQLNEGVYKMVEEQGDNITSMYFNDDKAADGKSDMHNPTCDCMKLNKNQQKDKGTKLQWESGDCIPTSTKPPIDCQCHNQYERRPKTCSPPPILPPSTAAPSTSSFITANNDKNAATEGGYIKLVDETGQEAGKFFIGASGLINNNAYEVVIQVRKKDRASDDKNSVISGQHKNLDKELNIKNTEKELPTSEIELSNIRLTSEKDVHKPLEPKNLLEKECELNTPRNLQSPEYTNVVTEKVEEQATNTKSIESIRLIQSEPKSTCDKGVGINTNHESNAEPKPAVTTFTQTSSRSPVHRPLFFHMSSSTSTAYLSPPEIILPKFLKPDYATTEDEMFEPLKSIELTEKELEACSCRKCIHDRKLKMSKVNIPVNCKKNKNINKRTKTPPNSERSPNEIRRELYENLKERRVGAPCKTARTDSKPKCKKESGKAEHVHKHCHKKKRSSVENIRTTRSMNMHVVNFTSKNNYKSTKSCHAKRLGKSELNPIIKDYVNKLLALNREGLKAVEVADQECSSVGTPGSSIINVPRNVDERKPSLAETISLEQIKNILRQQIIESHMSNNFIDSRTRGSYTTTKHNLKHSSSRVLRKKPIHKVKSLNISKHLLKNNKSVEAKSVKPTSPSSTDDYTSITSRIYKAPRSSRSKSSPTPRQQLTAMPLKFNESESTAKNSTGTDKTEDYNNRSEISRGIKSISPRMQKKQPEYQCREPTFKLTKPTSTISADSDSMGETPKPKEDVAISMSTQTSHNIDSEMNFMKLAEDKLQNMEKIADLTEKCTKRLSNLAKVLEEVRKNKSLVYSQISSESADSQSEKSEKVVTSAAFDHSSLQGSETKSPEPVLEMKNTEILTENEISPSSQYTSVLTDIPKPVFKQSESSIADFNPEKLDSNVNTTEVLYKNRPRPPPALSRLQFKHGQEYIIPHELSTVIEVDSPMSMKHRNQSSRNDAKEVSTHSNRSSLGDKDSVEENVEPVKDKSNVNPDLLETNNDMKKPSTVESTDDSKFHMIDLKQFNEIMLEPFLSIHEYAKQYNMEPPDDGSNLDDIHKDDVINDDLSSLHSDGSLPDVIAELLKRNIIAEPFKFDTASNANSTTISSESTLSMLALSKVRKERKRSSIVFQNKENIAETSDTLSISSNPDLENAFKKLGMGWASSTLKKTKERLALSSSSNTSSSSLSQFKIKNFNQDIPALVTDSISSAVSLSKKTLPTKNLVDKPKHVEQQTSLSNSMTVKEFLRNELAKKITFNKKSNVNDTEEEFVSLFETKIPEDMKEKSQVNCDERSAESAPSGANRARTSTPVQIYKSMTYHSSSSSNISNGLFSNADELSSVKMTSNSMKNHSTSEKDDLTIPNFSLRMKKNSSDCSKSD